ncbi:MAG: hypothetical protein RLY92_1418, partial [Chloroflexota bacterium]
TVFVDRGGVRGIVVFVFVALAAVRNTTAWAEGTLVWVPVLHAAHYSYDAQQKLAIRFAG